MAWHGSRGPRRGRNSVAKIHCAYKKCRSSRDVKNNGTATTAARSAINEAMCRELHGACRLVRFCCPSHKRLCMAGPDSAKRGPREGLDIEQYSCLFATLVSTGAAMMAAVTLLQIVCGERADCHMQKPRSLAPALGSEGQFSGDVPDREGQREDRGEARPPRARDRGPPAWVVVQWTQGACWERVAAPWHEPRRSCRVPLPWIDSRRDRTEAKPPRL